MLARTVISRRSDWSWRKLLPCLSSGGLLGRPCLYLRIRWDKLPIRLPARSECYRPHELKSAGMPAELAKLFDGVSRGWKYVDIWTNDAVHLHIEFLGYPENVPRQPLQRVSALILALQARGIDVEVHSMRPSRSTPV